MKYRIVKDWVMVYNDTGLILSPPRQMNRKFPLYINTTHNVFMGDTLEECQDHIKEKNLYHNAPPVLPPNPLQEASAPYF